MADGEHNPAILIPYPGAGEDPAEQDIFVYLRPESNGVLVESTLLRVVKRSEKYKKQIFLVYLANLPGEFIMRNRITENHYPLKLKFAARGRRLFTPAMKEAFSRKFRTGFEEAKILGAFEALDVLGMNPEELFSVWATDHDFMAINDQTIKKIHGHYVVNCDIPQLVSLRYAGKNIAVMIFRTSLSCREFAEIVRMMEKALLDAGILLPDRPASRIFHYSRGPFEQVLDGQGYLYTREADRVPPEQLPFPRFLASRGVEFSVVEGILQHPLIRYSGEGGLIREESIYSHTRGASYAEAWEKLRDIRSQVILCWGKEDQEALDRFAQREFRETV
ncbi:MAG: hypothetical protein FWG35_05825 [Spirochaetaceae bacterium]|nr:hypothetical protein [Spirochaetaceae bacterium]